MRFQIDTSDRLAIDADFDRAYLGRLEGRVYPTEVRVEGNYLICRREVSESARLFVSYAVPGFGRPVLNTAALREQEEPYVLAVELARGRIGLVRDQLAAWQQSGMTISDDAVTALQEAQKKLRVAACCENDGGTPAGAAQAALIAACQASDILVASYVRQRLAIRRRRSSHLPILLGCPLRAMRPARAGDKAFVSAFTATTAAVEWGKVEPSQGEYEWTLQDEQVEFAERNRLVAIAGPLLDFGNRGMPEWLWQWGRDYYALQSFVSDFVETAITRYASRVRTWEIAARANTGGGLALDEEHRLALTARAIEVAKQTDDELQLSLRIDQPAGEYQAAGLHRLSPLQFVDALIRSGAGLTCLTLEYAVGYRPCGSDYRDRFELSRLIDLWSTLGLPLTISLAFPSQAKSDPNAEAGIEVREPQWKAPWSEPAQGEWLAEMLPLLMSKPSVAGIEWCCFSDAVAHRFPHSGLTRPDGSSKPAFERLGRFREAYWQRNRDAG
ncbi:MAG: endo-1,4-beta-xylanase [Planctomycetota bacterium]|nr:glycoside hydrolase [Planctomycetaceae bacterium]MDQ3329588.1 endo-1,4-beta-xylanase [Planctomycetota bacterium]